MLHTCWLLRIFYYHKLVLLLLVIISNPLFSSLANKDYSKPSDPNITITSDSLNLDNNQPQIYCLLEKAYRETSNSDLADKASEKCRNSIK